MGIILRSETDLFRLYNLCDIFVNPTNAIGMQESIGLTGAFKEKFPNAMRSYRDMAIAGQVKVGMLHHAEENNRICVNLPTRNHHLDAIDIKDITAAVKRLRDYLLTQPTYHVALPILGTAAGQLTFDDVYPVMMEYLDDVPNTIHLCCRPSTFEKPLKYLAIVGSRFYHDYDFVEQSVLKTLTVWGWKVSDFDRIVSGAAKGVDTLAKRFAETHHPRPCFEIPADWNRFGYSAGGIRNASVADIATHSCAFPCEDSKRSPGTYNYIRRIASYNNQKDVIDEKRIHICPV